MILLSFCNYSTRGWLIIVDVMIAHSGSGKYMPWQVLWVQFCFPSKLATRSTHICKFHTWMVKCWMPCCCACNIKLIVCLCNLSARSWLLLVDMITNSGSSICHGKWSKFSFILEVAVVGQANCPPGAPIFGSLIHKWWNVGYPVVTHAISDLLSVYANVVQQVDCSL